jgi:apolipoprotein N-acyltransferase
MDLLSLLLGLALFVGVVAGTYFGYTAAVRSVNDTASIKYGHRPVNLLNGLILLVPLAIFVLGLGMSETDISNLYVGSFIAVIGVGWMMLSIAKKTDWGTAAVSVLLLFIGIVLSVVIVFALFLLFSGSGQKKKGKN